MVDSQYGYFVECDLEYPYEIKEKTKHFPFCPETKKISTEMFSPYMSKMKPNGYKPTEKLICDQTNKTNYLVHYRLLQFYVRHGMKITKIDTI